MARRTGPAGTSAVRRVVAPLRVIVLATVLAVAAVGCGRPADDATAPTDRGTTAAPTTTATAAPDPSGRATGPGGEPVTVARDLPGLPPDWPTDLPVAEGATSLTVTGFAQGAPQDGRSVTYASTRTARDLVAFYKAQLAAEGWTVDAEVPTTTGSAISASKEEGGTTRTLFLTVSETGGTTEVVLAESG